VGSISTSKKVNSVSLKAALIYTWSISHEDDDGYQDGEPKDIKHNIVPYRDDISVEDCKKAIIELSIASYGRFSTRIPHVIYKIQITFKRQTYHGIKKIPSKIKNLLGSTPESVYYNTKEGVRVHQDGRTSEVKLSEVKGSEVKGSEVKGSEEGKPFSLSLTEERKNNQRSSSQNRSQKEVNMVVPEHAIYGRKEIAEFLQWSIYLVDKHMPDFKRAGIYIS